MDIDKKIEHLISSQDRKIGSAKERLVSHLNSHKRMLEDLTNDIENGWMVTRPHSNVDLIESITKYNILREVREDSDYLTDKQ